MNLLRITVPLDERLDPFYREYEDHLYTFLESNGLEPGTYTYSFTTGVLDIDLEKNCLRVENKMRKAFNMRHFTIEVVT